MSHKIARQGGSIDRARVYVHVARGVSARCERGLKLRHVVVIRRGLVVVGIATMVVYSLRRARSMTVVDESERLPGNPHTLCAISALYIASTAPRRFAFRLDRVGEKRVPPPVELASGCNLLSRIDLDGRVLFFFFLFCFSLFLAASITRKRNHSTWFKKKTLSRRYISPWCF